MDASERNTIPENIRRDIFDWLRVNRIWWAGRLEEIEFLGRVFNLDELPSQDFRFSTAAQDIWQHRINNYDWDDNWIYGDSRFDLLRCSDEMFLQFLCEMLHPIVRADEAEVASLASLFNDNLKRVGWELREQLQLGGRPVYAAHITASAFNKHAVSQVATKIGTEYISQQINRMERAVVSDPELAIGTAKEFVETICKTILDERKVAYSSDTFAKLVRTTLKELKLAPDDISRSGFASETIRVLLQNLATISDKMAELRGQFGTGHGKSATSKSLGARHARLAVGASTTLGVFIYETHIERRLAEAVPNTSTSVGESNIALNSSA